MRAIHIDGATRTLGAPHKWKPGDDGACLGLPIRDAQLPSGQPCMISAWRPTREELERLAQGASIELCVIGSGHPPVALSVGPTPPAIPDFPAEAIGAAIRETIEREKQDPGGGPGKGLL